MSEKDDNNENNENYRRKALLYLRLCTLFIILAGFFILLFSLNKFAPILPIEDNPDPIIATIMGVSAIVIGVGLLIFSYLPVKKELP